MSSPQIKYSTGVVAYPVFFIILIWVVFWLQVRFFSGIKSLGIYPQTLEGLRGILFSPFIHADIGHLYRNSLPLLILSMALFYFYRKIAWKVLLYGILISGIITWIIGRPANHIGASSVIYVLASFIFFKGVFAKHYRLIALSFTVVFLYGGMIWYLFPVKEGISWEGHLGGFIAGLLFALVFKRSIVKPEKYYWQQLDYNEEEDEFLKHFDEDGNFIESKPIEQISEEENPEITITYTYKEKDS